MSDFLKTPTYRCLRMPEVLEVIFDKDVPGISTETRKALRFLLEHLDGSGPNRGMTCIEKEDVAVLERKIYQGIDQQFFDYDPGLHYQNSLYQLMRSLDRSCFECNRQNCENRVAFTRVELLQALFMGTCQNPRLLKTDPNYAGASLESSTNDHTKF